MNPWPACHLRRVFHVVNGGTPTADPTNWSGSVAWATPVDLASVNGGRIASTERRLTAAGLASGSRVVPEGSLLLSTRAPIGYVVETTTTMAFNQGCRGLVPRGVIDSRYFRYQLLSMASRLTADGQGSTFQELSAEALAAAVLKVPPLGSQRAVADYLDTETARIDALIAKKRSLCELVGQASAARVEESISAAALDARVIHLGQVLERIIDYRGATPEKFDQGVPLITASNVVDGQVRLDLSRQFVSEETYRSWMRRGLPQEGDLLLTTEAPLGHVAMYPDHRAALAQRIVLLRPRLDLVRPDFLYCYLRSASGRADLLSRATGSTVIGVRTDRLREVAVIVPTLEAQDEIVLRYRAAERRERDLNKRLADQCVLLLEHRQALITAAVAGELEVPGAAA